LNEGDKMRNENSLPFIVGGFYISKKTFENIKRICSDFECENENMFQCPSHSLPEKVRDIIEEVLENTDDISMMIESYQFWVTENKESEVFEF